MQDSVMCRVRASPVDPLPTVVQLGRGERRGEGCGSPYIRLLHSVAHIAFILRVQTNKTHCRQSLSTYPYRQGDDDNHDSCLRQ